MPRFPIVGPSYTSQALNADAQSTMNWYPEIIESGDGNSQAALYPTPGLKQFVNLAVSLAVVKSHTGNFTQGQTGATYSVVVTNNGPVSTSGTVTLTENAPSGLTFVSLSGTGWTIASNVATRSDVLAPGASYPTITVTVNVASNASSPQVNHATVSGGGLSVPVTASDSTIINQGHIIVATQAGLTGTPTAGPFSVGPLTPSTSRDFGLLFASAFNNANSYENLQSVGPAGWTCYQTQFTGWAVGFENNNITSTTTLTMPLVGMTYDWEAVFALLSNAGGTTVIRQLGYTANQVSSGSNTIPFSTPITSALTASGGQTIYNGNFPSISLAGLPVTIAGFVTHPSNNGNFTIVSNTTTQMTTNNAAGIAETQAATAAINPLTGNTIILAIQLASNGTSPTISGISDTLGNSFSLVAQIVQANAFGFFHYLGVFAGLNGGSGADSVSFSANTFTSGSGIAYLTELT